MAKCGIRSAGRGMEWWWWWRPRACGGVADDRACCSMNMGRNAKLRKEGGLVQHARGKGFHSLGNIALVDAERLKVMIHTRVRTSCQLRNPPLSTLPSLCRLYRRDLPYAGSSRSPCYQHNSDTKHLFGSIPRLHGCSFGTSHQSRHVLHEHK